MINRHGILRQLRLRPRWHPIEQHLSQRLYMVSQPRCHRRCPGVGAGLASTSRGAVIVDDHPRTSDPKIYAIGECVAHGGQVYGLAAPAYAMADTVADGLMVKDTVFTGSALSTRLKLLGVDVSVFGDYLQPSDTLVYRSEGIYRKLALHNGLSIPFIRKHRMS